MSEDIDLSGIQKILKFVARAALPGVLILLLNFSVQAQQPGEKIVTANCAACHATGIAGAPVIGNRGQWSERIKQGMETLVNNAMNGIRGMPPKGGNKALTTQQIQAAVSYLVAASKASGTTKNSPKARPAKAVPKPKPKSQVAAVNSFSRLMKPASKRNPPPASDGIHDPENAGTDVLQPPRESFSLLPKGTSGNYVDWVKSLDDGDINPRYDRLDTEAKPIILDMNIVREVKGSMPDVVYPHKQHTQWLDCSNCHPAIFEPKKGANVISMAAIILGEKCGVCHGKVAFPVADCRRCHSRKEKASLQSVKKN